MQAHFIPSGTRLAQVFQDSCFLDDTNMFAKQGMDRSPRTLTLWQIRAVCTQTEPTGREIIVIVAERGRQERREQRKREEKENDGREKEKMDKRQREKRAPSPSLSPPSPPPLLPSLPRVYAQNVSVCRFKTAPCMPAKRAHVFNMRAFCRYTRRRLERKHGDVFSIHTGGFSACQAAPQTPHTAHHRHHTHHAHRAPHIAHQHQHQHNT